ncbi:hypothetical protein ACP70R_023913 [Stipagrostis hirtigluma subsp. patula]
MCLSDLSALDLRPRLSFFECLSKGHGKRLAAGGAEDLAGCQVEVDFRGTNISHEAAARRLFHRHGRLAHVPKRAKHQLHEYPSTADATTAAAAAAAPSHADGSGDDGVGDDQSLEPRSLPLEDLTKITNNFSEERLLGTGGFGMVYKGVLQNGDVIAMKKLTLTMSGIQDRQFENEVRLLMGLEHLNIVQLVGYCSATEKVPLLHDGKYIVAEKPERLLCLEYLPKGSLREHLSDESSGLDWDIRYKIIEGICNGLHYLHEAWKANTPIIHMDLKPPNKLLDDNMVPKIADFGLSRLFGEEQTRACTKSRDGTLGYMAPEYLNRGVITKKLDIFSLGVIIIEITTGRKDYPFDETETYSQKFVELVITNWRNYASGEIGCQQIRRCIEIGLACVKLNWEERPTIGQIIKMLHGSRTVECSSERERSYRKRTPERICDSSAPMQVSDGAWFEFPKAMDVTVASSDGEGNELGSKRRQLELYAIDMSTASIAVREPPLKIRKKTELDIIHDGFHWRKYKEKVVKGNPNPRSYYRCVHPGCRARKEVQRDSQEPKDLLFTYEGRHCHDAPEDEDTPQLLSFFR